MVSGKSRKRSLAQYSHHRVPAFFKEHVSDYMIKLLSLDRFKEISFETLDFVLDIVFATSYTVVFSINNHYRQESPKFY